MFISLSAQMTDVEGELCTVHGDAVKSVMGVGDGGDDNEHSIQQTGLLKRSKGDDFRFQAFDFSSDSFCRRMK